MLDIGHDLTLGRPGGATVVVAAADTAYSERLRQALADRMQGFLFEWRLDGASAAGAGAIVDGE